MGKAMDAIVVDDEKTAKECIQYMREQRAGTATFLPLDVLRAKPIDDRLRLLGHDTRLATDLLQFEARFAKAVHYACGNVVVCPSLDVARQLCFGSTVASAGTGGADSAGGGGGPRKLKCPHGTMGLSG